MFRQFYVNVLVLSKVTGTNLVTNISTNVGNQIHLRCYSDSTVSFISLLNSVIVGLFSVISEHYFGFSNERKLEFIISHINSKSV